MPGHAVCFGVTSFDGEKKGYFLIRSMFSILPFIQRWEKAEYSGILGMLLT